VAFTTAPLGWRENLLFVSSEQPKKEKPGHLISAAASNLAYFFSDPFGGGFIFRFRASPHCKMNQSKGTGFVLNSLSGRETKRILESRSESNNSKAHPYRGVGSVLTLGLLGQLLVQ